MGDRFDVMRGLRGRLERFMWLAGLMLVAKVTLARHLMLGRAFGTGALADILAIIALIALSAAIGGSVGRWIVAAGSIVVSASVLGGVMYASYFGEVPGLSMLAVSGHSLLLGREIFELFAWEHLLFIIDLPFTLAASFRRPRAATARRRTLSLVGTISLATFLLFIAGAFMAPSPIDSRTTSHRYGVVAYGIASSLPRDAFGDRADATGRFGALQKEIDELTGRVPGERRPNAPERGAMQGKNLIVVQVEALQAGLIGARVNGQAIVPNLEAVAWGGVYFPNTYSQIGRGNTSDAEFIANTSLYPSMQLPSSVAYAKKALPSLPRLLGAQGYDTYTFHTNNVEFWNRSQLYPALGFGRYYDDRYFGRDDVLGYGASDSILYDKTLRVLSDSRTAGKPFYAHIVTVSSHYPFKATAGRGHLKLPSDVAASATGRYLQAMSYADAQFGWFIQQLEMSGLLDESVIVVYGDHFGMRFEDNTEVDKRVRKELFGHSYNRANFYNIPLIFHIPGTEARKDDVVLGQVDIMPTIADLFDIDLSTVPHFGRSAFDDTPTLLTRSSSIPTYIDDEVMYLQGVTNGEDRWYSPVTQKMRKRGTKPARFADTAKLVELSNSYAKHLPDRTTASNEIGRIPEGAKNFEKTPFK